MKKVEAWQTIDGKLFSLKDEKFAKRHNDDIKKSVKRNEDFNKHKSDMINKIIIGGEIRDNIKNEDVSVYHEGEYGWDCENSDNPIDKCIYSQETHWRDDSCIYCGQPEERK